MENQTVSLLTIVNFAAIIFRYLVLYLCVCVCGYVFISFEQVCRSGRLDHIGGLCLNYLRNRQNVFQSRCSVLYS